MLDIQSAPPRRPAGDAVRRCRPEPLRGARRARRIVRRGLGLASRLLLLTISFALLAQVLIFVPRLAAVHDNWLRGRLAAANTAALVFAASPDDMLPKERRQENSRQRRRRDHRPENPRHASPAGGRRNAARRSTIPTTCATPRWCRASQARSARCSPRRAPSCGSSAPPRWTTRSLEITLDETPLTEAMWRFTRNFLTIVMTISAVVVLVIWASIWLMVLRPVRRLDLQHRGVRRAAAGRRRGSFRPAAAATRSALAEQALATMQTALSQQLGEKRRLAELGLAVAKINHDLRNMLTAAQLISDRLATIPDPLADSARAASDRDARPRDHLLPGDPGLWGGVGEAAGAAALRAARGHPARRSKSSQDPADRPRLVCYRRARDFEIYADPDQLLRVIENLHRNALQALAQFGPNDGRPAAIRYAATRADERRD